MRHLQAENVLLEPRILQSKTEEIVKQFDHDRVERVTKAIREAREASKKLTHDKASIHVSSSDFEQYIITCPICGSDTVARGETEFELSGDRDDPAPSLTFILNEFHCEDCGLKVDDRRDFPLAGLDYAYDRSDHLHEWGRQNGFDDFDPD